MSNIDAIAWHWHNSGGRTHPVGEKMPNAFGLYDTLGNVAVRNGCRTGVAAFREAG